MERIQKRCPDLLPALASAPWSDLLPQSLRERREEISAGSLRELEELMRNADARRAARGAGPRKLAPVLAELGEKGQQGATRWERFKRWLKEKLETRKDEDDEEPCWRNGAGSSRPARDGAGHHLHRICDGRLLVLFVIWSELRAAGLARWHARARAASPAAEWRRRLMLADVAAAPLADRPGMLLRLLGEALTVPTACRRPMASRPGRSCAARDSIRTRSAKNSRRSPDSRSGPVRRIRRRTNRSKAPWPRPARCSRIARLAAGKR